MEVARKGGSEGSTGVWRVFPRGIEACLMSVQPTSAVYYQLGSGLQSG